MNNLSSLAQNVQFWSRWSSATTIVYIVLTGLLFVVTALVSYSSFRSQQFNSLMQSAKDNEIKTVQSEAAVKIVSAAKEIATLKTQAATLNTQAAELNAEAEKAKEGMAKANARIAEAQSGVAEANKQAQVAIATAAEARAKQEEITHENYKLKLKLEASIIESQTKQRALEAAQLVSQKKIDVVRQDQLPRVLNAKQNEQLVSFLKVNAGSHLAIDCTLGDAESLSFASQISNAITSAGWIVDNGGPSQAIFTLKQVGINIYVHDGHKAPVSALTLLNGLKSIGYAPVWYSDASVPEKQVQLVIGLKQPSVKS